MMPKTWLLQKGKKVATLQEIISKAEEEGFKKEIAQDLIQKLKDAGEIIEYPEDHFRVV